MPVSRTSKWTAARSFDGVFMDCQMPGLDGYGHVAQCPGRTDDPFILVEDQARVHFDPSNVASLGDTAGLVAEDVLPLACNLRPCLVQIPPVGLARVCLQLTRHACSLEHIGTPPPSLNEPRLACSAIGSDQSRHGAVPDSQLA